jgi:hypothetical protein
MISLTQNLSAENEISTNRIPLSGQTLMSMSATRRENAPTLPLPS